MGAKIINMIYQDNIKLKNLTEKLVIILILILTLEKIGIDVSIILGFYYLIISLIALLLIFSNKNEENRILFLDSAWIFFTISMFNIYAVVLKQERTLGMLFYERIEYFELIKIANIILGISFIIEVLNEKRDVRKNIGYILLGVVIETITIIFYEKEILIGVFIIFLSIWIIKLIKKVNKMDKRKEERNYIRFYLIMILFNNVMILLGSYFNHIIIEYISQGITFVVFTSFFLWVVEEVLNSPYSKVKQEMNRFEKRVVELNNSLEIKNTEIDVKKANIREIEQTFKWLFRCIPIPTVIINSIKGNIIYINKPGMELLGETSIANLLGRNLMELIEMIEDEEIKKISPKVYLAETRKTRKKIAIEYEEENNERGEEILLLTDLTIQIEGNNIENLIKERKLGEEMKKKFLSNISHDLKTPINVIYSSAQVQDIYLKNENLKELEIHKNICKQNALWLRRLTNNIIDMGKIELGFLGNGIMEKENIVEFIEDIFTGLIQYAKDEEIEMVFDTDEEEIFVEFNRDYMERIILNIISNAIKYNKKNGCIEVYIKRREDEVEVLIRDEGIGMKKEFVEQIFERYTKCDADSKEIHKSSGIGMYVVKRLVEAQNGKITVRSDYGKGTEVTIKFARIG